MGAFQFSAAMGKKAKNAGKKEKKSNADGGSVTEQFQKEFMQQQDKITKAAIQLENMSERKDKQARELRRAVMTAKEVDGIDDDRILYKQFGRMFLHQDKPAILEQLEASATKSQKEVKTVEDTMQYFEKQRSEAESTLREMMAQLESQMA